MSINLDVQINQIITDIESSNGKMSKKTISDIDSVISKISSLEDKNKVIELSNVLCSKYIDVRQKNNKRYFKDNTEEKLANTISKLNAIPEVQKHFINHLDENPKLKLLQALPKLISQGEVTISKRKDLRSYNLVSQNPTNQQTETKMVSSIKELKSAYARYEGLKKIEKIQKDLRNEFDAALLDKTPIIVIRSTTEIKQPTHSDSFPIYILPGGTIYHYTEEGLIESVKVDLNDSSASLKALEQIIQHRSEKISFREHTAPKARFGNFHEDDHHTK